MTYDLVLRLLGNAGCLDLGYHIVMDNLFTSPKLFLDLYNNCKTHATGTVRRNRKGLPKQILQAKPGNKKTIERRRGPLLAVAYKDGSKCPILLSTTSTAGFTETTRARTKEVVKLPKIVKEYNANMGGWTLET